VTVKGIAFAKRYLKYLTKKYLKSKGIRDFLRVVAHGKTAYVLRLFNIDEDEEEDEEEEA
jgi:large subunit ribosomal protein L22e